MLITKSMSRGWKDPVEVLRASSPEEFADPRVRLLDRATWRTETGRFVFSGDPERSNVVDRILRDATAVGDCFEVRSGLQAYERGKGVPPQTAADVKNHIFDRNAAEDDNSYCYLQGRDVTRHCIVWSGMWMQYGPWLAQPRDLQIFTRPRVLLREISGALPFCLHAAFTDSPYLNNKSILNVLDKDDDKRLLKLLALALSSRLISLYYKDRAVKSARKIFPKVVIRNLREFPFPKTVPEDTLSRACQLSDRMLLLHKQLAASKTPTDKTPIRRQIDGTDRQIDNLVYELYGLTADEIRIVEDAASS